MEPEKKEHHLVKYQYEKGQEKTGGREVGTKNRSTILKEFLALEVTKVIGRTKTFEGKEVTLTNEQWMTNGIVNKANKGDVPAWKAIQDNIYGLLKQETEHTLKQDIDVKEIINTAFNRDGDDGNT